jgi:hypothetical protein
VANGMKDKMTLSAAILADVGSEFRPQSNRPGAAPLVFEARCSILAGLVYASVGHGFLFPSRFLITDRCSLISTAGCMLSKSRAPETATQRGTNPCSNPW